MSDYIDGIVMTTLHAWYEGNHPIDVEDCAQQIARAVAAAAEKRVRKSARVCERCYGHGFYCDDPENDDLRLKCSTCTGTGIVFAPPTGEGKEEGT